MANFALGQRIVNNLQEFKHDGFSMIAFKVIFTKIRAVCKTRNIRNMIE